MNGIQWGKVDHPEKINDVVIVCSGSSLTEIDLTKLKSKSCFIITVNGAGNSIDFADAWFTLDPWGLAGPQLPSKHTGKLYAAVPEDFGTNYARCKQHRCRPPRNVTFLHRLMGSNMINDTTSHKLGLSEDKSCINTGNSGYGAINLAYHLRPKRIVILGMDAGMGYFYTKEKTNRTLNVLPQLCASAVPQLNAAGIEVINGSQISKVKCFPTMSPTEAIGILHDK